MPIVTVPAAGQYGVIKDQAPQELVINSWSDVSNVRFRDGYLERIEGQTQIYDTPSVTPYFVTPYSTLLGRYIAHAGLAAVFVDDGTGRTEITGTAPTGNVDDRWTGGAFNGFLVLNNGVDQPFSWDGNTANNLVTLSAWDSNNRAAVIRPFKNYLVALNITKSGTNYPHQILISNAADPGTLPTSWDPTDPTVDVYQQDIAETDDLMVDFLPLGAAGIIYKERSMYAINYIGGQYIWQVNKLPDQSGMLARGCGVVTPVGHVVLTAGDLIVHQGSGIRSVVTGRMRRWLFNAIDSTHYSRCFLSANLARNEVWVCFPETGQTTCSKALVWNYLADTFSIVELSGVTYGCSGQVVAASDSTWASDSASWDSDVTSWNQNTIPPSESRMVFCTTAPKIVMQDAGSDFAGTAFTASAERLGLALDDTSNTKTIKAVIPRIDGTTGQTVYIQVGATMDPETPYTWADPFSYTIGSSYKADTFATGRYLAWRIYSTASFAWRVKSVDFEIVKRGRY